LFQQQQRTAPQTFLLIHFTMAPNDVGKALLRHFDEHQKSSGRRSLSVEARVAAIYRDIDDIELQLQVANVTLSNDEDGLVKDVDQVLSSTLIHFLDCSLATEVSPDARESVEMIQELAVAVAAQRAQVVRTILQSRLVPLTVVLLERVRSSSCRCIGLAVKYLLKCGSITKGDLDDLLDTASQALLPRFTDKTQAVRQSAIEAARFFFGKTAGRPEGEMDDPDIRQSLQWSLQHDPSVTNRVVALESLPITIQTMDVVLTRVRDVKPKVRVAAIKALQKAIPDLHMWEAEQCAELIASGLTHRCASTKAEVERMVFVWIKSFGFDFHAFFRHLNVIEYEESCKKVFSVLLNADDEFLLDAFTADDLMAFKNGIKQASTKLSPQQQLLEVEQAFMVQCQCTAAEKMELRRKEQVLSELLPDIPELCAMFELHASALMQAIAQEKGMDTIDRFVSICANLLAMIQSADIEEGSRLHLSTTLKGMLGSIVLPDDLVEGSIETLHRIHRTETDFWESVLATVESLQDQDSTDDGLSDNRTLRTLSILCTVFERSSSKLASSSRIADFEKFVLPAVSHENALVREAAVSCLGKLGLFTSQEKVSSDYKPILIERLLDEDEKLSIRAQAILGLSDWSVLFKDFLGPNNDDGGLTGTIFRIMQNTEVSLACVAAEAMSKLFFSGRIVDESCLAQLLVLFFDPRLAVLEDEEADDLGMEVGSPIRLQQLLTQFFPLFCIRGFDERRKLISALTPALEIVLSNNGGRKKRGAKSFPIAKMVDFVTATANHAQNMPKEKGEIADEAFTESSTDLLIAVQISKFLACNSDELNVATLRSLCKILSTTEINPEQADTADIRLLVDNMEDLGNLVSDETSLKHLAILNGTLEDVDVPNNESAMMDEEDTESLNHAMERVHISPARSPRDKENTSSKKPSTSGKGDAWVSPSVRRTRLSISSVNEALLDD
jgi:condensin complex subunit 3